MMFKGKRQFCQFAVKFDSLPLEVKQKLEQEFVVKAKQYCQREGLKPDEIVITMIKASKIQFSFVVMVK